jgi:hypothetical protein
MGTAAEEARVVEREDEMSDTPRTEASAYWFHGRRVVDIDGSRTLEVELAAMTDERDEARAEALEQARLNGMGSEREARLMAQVQEARAELARLTTLFGEPVAWQERLSDSEGGWGYWYESHDRTIDDPLEEVSPGGLRIQWRPLYARTALKEEP